jgi:hypothetical protein
MTSDNKRTQSLASKLEQNTNTIYEEDEEDEEEDENTPRLQKSHKKKRFIMSSPNYVPKSFSLSEQMNIKLNGDVQKFKNIYKTNKHFTDQEIGNLLQWQLIAQNSKDKDLCKKVEMYMKLVKDP